MGHEIPSLSPPAGAPAVDTAGQIKTKTSNACRGTPRASGLAAATVGLIIVLVAGGAFAHVRVWVQERISPRGRTSTRPVFVAAPAGRRLGEASAGEARFNSTPDRATERSANHDLQSPAAAANGNPEMDEPLQEEDEYSMDEAEDGSTQAQNRTSRCSCADGAPVDCKAPRLEKLASQVCAIRDTIRTRRHRCFCQMKSIARKLNRPTGYFSFRIRDRVYLMPCKDVLDVRLKSRLDGEAKLLEINKQLKLLNLIPMLTVASKLSSLWKSRSDQLFYTKGNMLALRGLEGSGRKVHREPFTNATSRFLPEETPKISFRTCAVVGNDGELMQRGQSLNAAADDQGSEIDSHDAVYRMNQAPTNQRVAGHVGKRTSVRVINRAWSRGYSGSYKRLLDDDPDGMILMATRAATRSIEHLGRMFQEKYVNKTILFPTTQIVIDTHQLVQGSRFALEEGLGVAYKGGNMPSSGLLSVYLALQSCGKVDVYGFSMKNCVGRSCPRYHYFTRKEVPDRAMKVGFKGHQYDIEGMILRAWHVLGVACIRPAPSLLGRCGSRLGGLVGTDGEIKDFAKLKTALSNPGLLAARSVDKTRGRQSRPRFTGSGVL